MFTGLIEETGTLADIQPMTDGKRLTITANTVLDDLKIDDSIAVNGVCLTAVNVDRGRFVVEAVGETLSKTTIGYLQRQDRVNLERAMRLSDRLGGHIVQGHVNGVGKVTALQKRGENWFAEIQIPEQLTTYVIDEGSIAVDGISLTVATLKKNKVGISVIPHTFQSTIISEYTVGRAVNIETDFLARYVEKMLKPSSAQPGPEKFSNDWFKEQGY